MRSADVIVIGAGLIGLALARELDRAGVRVLVIEKDRAGAAASWAGAGMLAAEQMRSRPLRSWARASARMYPEFVGDLENETGTRVGFRASGTVFIGPAHEEGASEPYDRSRWQALDAAAILQLVPILNPPAGCAACWIPGDHSIDNRRLGTALAQSVRQRGIGLIEGEAVRHIVDVGVEGAGWRVETGVRTYAAAVVVNAAGAWAGGIGAPAAAPVRPRKGQMLALQSGDRARLGSVVHAPDVYMVPREGGRVLIGATVEDVGFNADIDADALERLRAAAVRLVPALADAPVVERWLGFRPGTPDNLPLVGETHRRGYWLATGHFRDGILLAPLTALVLARGICGALSRTQPDRMPRLPDNVDPEQFSPASMQIRGL